MNILHVKIEFMAINLGVLHAGLDKGDDAGVAHSTGQLIIQFRGRAKDFGRIRNSDTRRFE
jgi:hypothetical protein